MQVQGRPAGSFRPCAVNTTDSFCYDPALRREGELAGGNPQSELAELEARFGHTPRRKLLLRGLREALQSLRQAGCGTAYLDGSFVTAKSDPNDFDACWEAVGVDSNALDPVLLDFSEYRHAQKMRFGGELFPTGMVADLKGTPFLDFFQGDHVADHTKGIVEIDLETAL